MPTCFTSQKPVNSNNQESRFYFKRIWKKKSLPMACNDRGYNDLTDIRESVRYTFSFCTNCLIFHFIVQPTFQTGLFYTHGIFLLQSLLQLSRHQNKFSSEDKQMYSSPAEHLRGQKIHISSRFLKLNIQSFILSWVISLYLWWLVISHHCW